MHLKQASFEISEDTWWTIFGAILAIIGCIFQAIGFIIQKIAHNRIEKYNLEMSRENSNASIIINNGISNHNKSDISHASSYDADEDIFSDEDDMDITESLKKYNNIMNINDIEMKKQGNIKSPRISQTKRKLKNKFKRKNKNFKKNNRSPSFKKQKKKTYVKSKFWLLGFFLNGVVGSLLNIIALNYAPQSVVLPLSATTLVGNTILATKYLNEPFPIQDVLGVGLVIIGSIGTIIVGPKESHDTKDEDGDVIFTVADLQSQWQDSAFLIFFIAISFIIVMDFILIQIFNRINKRKKEDLIARGILMWEDQEISDHTIVYNASFYLLSYPLIASYFASVNFVVLKGFIRIISSSTASRQAAKDNFTFYLTYVYIGGIFIINFLLEMFRQKGLRSFGAIYVIPIYQVLVITVGTTMGAIYFKEMHNMKILNASLFLLSVFITCCGVIILALSNKISKFLTKNKNCSTTKKYLLTNNESDDSDTINKTNAHNINNNDDGQTDIVIQKTPHNTPPNNNNNNNIKKQSIASISSISSQIGIGRISIDNESNLSISSTIHSVNSINSISSLSSNSNLSHPSQQQLINPKNNNNQHINTDRIDEKSALENIQI